jgi:hypothetical protein
MTGLCSARIEKRDSFLGEFSTLQEMSADYFSSLVGQCF